MSAGYVYIRTLQLVAVRSVGPYGASARDAWAGILDWRIKSGLEAAITRGFGLMLDDPRKVDREECRYEACVEYNKEFEELIPPHFTRSRLLGGAYARQEHVGLGGLGAAISNLRDGWVPSQGLKVDVLRPFVEIHRDDPAVVPPENARVEICIPVTLAGNKARPVAA